MGKASLICLKSTYCHFKFIPKIINLLMYSVSYHQDLGKTVDSFIIKRNAYDPEYHDMLIKLADLPN